MRGPYRLARASGHGIRPLRWSRAQQRALQAGGLNKNEGHWFINQDSNIELYSTLERFLARHLGA